MGTLRKKRVNKTKRLKRLSYVVTLNKIDPSQIVLQLSEQAPKKNFIKSKWLGELENPESTSLKSRMVTKMVLARPRSRSNRKSDQYIDTI